MKPSKKHQRIVKDFEKQKEKHLERIATKLLKDDERNQKTQEQTN